MCCKGFLKMMMFIFNGGIFLAGAAILGVGIWVKVDSASLLGILDNLENGSELSQIIYVSYVLMAVGSVLLVIGFLGCCGAMRESKCMLLTFFSIVLIIFIVEIAGAVVLFVFQGVVDKLFNELENEVRESIKNNYGGTDSESMTNIWDNTMKELKCCGYKNYTDFTGSPFFSKDGFYPDSCCNETGIPDFKCSSENAKLSNVAGCYATLVQLIEDNATIVAAVALGIAALEIAAMVVSMVLYKDIKKNRG